MTGCLLSTRQAKEHLLLIPKRSFLDRGTVRSLVAGDVAKVCHASVHRYGVPCTWALTVWDDYQVKILHQTAAKTAATVAKMYAARCDGVTS